MGPLVRRSPGQCGCIFHQGKTRQGRRREEPPQGPGFGPCTGDSLTCQSHRVVGLCGIITQHTFEASLSQSITCTMYLCQIICNQYDQGMALLKSIDHLEKICLKTFDQMFAINNSPRSYTPLPALSARAFPAALKSGFEPTDDFLRRTIIKHPTILPDLAVPGIGCKFLLSA